LRLAVTARAYLVYHFAKFAMKKLRAPNTDGKDLWIIVHDLSIADARLRQLRPIHVLTHLGKCHPRANKHQTFAMCMALENKLLGVRYHHGELLRALAPLDRALYPISRVQEYHGEQAVICALEAYLNAIYTALEVVSLINRHFNGKLPMGFRDQSRKHAIFAFQRWPWLPIFYDIRTELTHYNTPIPLLTQRKLFMEFTTLSKLEHFTRGRYEISFDDICGFTHGLFDLCDAWANEELPHLDGNIEIDLFREERLGPPLVLTKVKISDVIGMLKSAS
jgi:hypothetical protein